MQTVDVSHKRRQEETTEKPHGDGTDQAGEPEVKPEGHLSDQGPQRGPE